jgi:hypothetical protein
MVARRYDVLCQPRNAERARELVAALDPVFVDGRSADRCGGVYRDR